MKNLKLETTQNNDNHPHLKEPFTFPELTNALKLIKTRKAPGPDGIHNEFLLHSGIKIQKWFLEFINNSFSTITIPKMWRRTKVIAILKPGKDPKIPHSYRPISLLCSSYKLVKRIILSRIYPVVDSILPDEQAGFRRGRSTTDQVTKLTQTIEHAFQYKQIFGAVFLDLTSAYDTVWHKGLHLKLLKSFDCKHMSKYIMELQYNRSFILSTSDGQSSKPHKVTNGVAQGLVLAPVLYNIYTSDFPATTSD